jgi:hypothetical protein|tara:strand:- start:526 stop:762 length:237 start_codon:yes stop_codon:yes gene_type:complete
MQQDNFAKIILISDLIKDKEAKEEELLYYERVMQELFVKMHMVKKEINLTNTIIDVIKNEKADILQQFIESKDDTRIL